MLCRRLKTHQAISRLGFRVPLGWRHFLYLKLRHFHWNIRSWVENECCCPCKVNNSNVNFTTKSIQSLSNKQLHYSIVYTRMLIWHNTSESILIRSNKIIILKYHRSKIEKRHWNHMWRRDNFYWFTMVTIKLHDAIRPSITTKVTCSLS